MAEGWGVVVRAGHVASVTPGTGERDHLSSQAELLDGTHLATFRHDRPGDFPPEGR